MSIEEKSQLMKNEFSLYNEFLLDYKDMYGLLMNLFEVYMKVVVDNLLDRKNILIFQKVLKEQYSVNEDIEFLTHMINICIKETNDITEYEGECGYIYLLTNPSMAGIVKIGKTTREPDIRVKELSRATGVPTPFDLIFKEYFQDCSQAENIIHNLLEEKGYRVSSNREFFNIPVPNAIDVIINIKDNMFNNNNHNIGVDDINGNYNSELVNLAGEGAYYLDESYNKGFAILENAGKLGSSKAYIVMGKTDLVKMLSEYDYYLKKSDLNKTFNYFEKGANINGFDSNHCIGEIALIYTGVYIGIDKSVINMHNSKVYWSRYIRNLSLKNLNSEDFNYLKHYITFFLYNYKDHIENELLEDSLICINWVKNRVKDEIEKEKNITETRREFALSFLKEKYTLNDSDNNFRAKVIYIRKIDNQDLLFKIKVVNGILKRGEVIKSGDSYGSFESFFNIKEIINNRQESIDLVEEGCTVSIIVNNTAKHYSLMRQELYVKEYISVSKTGSFNYEKPKLKKQEYQIKDKNKTLLEKFKDLFK